MTAMQSFWKRTPGRSTTATRADTGFTLNAVSFETLEHEILQHDIENPPVGWTWDGSTWTLGPWVVDRGTTTEYGPWRLRRGGTIATKKRFRTADRARHYAEIRLDRSHGGMRGPKATRTPTNNVLTCRVPSTLSNGITKAAQMHATPKADFTRGLLSLGVYLSNEGRLSVVDGQISLLPSAQVPDSPTDKTN